MRTATGLFVVFEGGDGAGKSTQAALLADRLSVRGHEVIRTYEPGDSPAGRKIRALVLDPASGEITPRAEALLYAADKAQHVATVVLPALRRGAVVVCDRYVDSMLAYQGAGRVLVTAEIEELAWWATGGLRPHLTVVLDVDPREAVGAKAGKDRLEAAGEAFHDRVRGFFVARATADPEHYLVLPGRDDRYDIAARVAARVESALADRPVDDQAGGQSRADSGAQPGLSVAAGTL